MVALSKRVQELGESATIKMASLAGELKAQGKDIISLSLGEPDFDTPDFIKAAAKDAIDENYSHYSPVPGFPELRDAICEKLKRDNGLSYERKQIVVSTGAKHSLMNVVLSLVNPGEEVVLPTPYWVSYEAMASFAGAKIVRVASTIDSDYKITPTQLDEALNENSKLFIFSNPCNPSGSVYSEGELLELAEVFKKYPNLFIISDEIYEYINFGTKTISLATISELYDRVITVNGLSKGYAMTGWRLGYIAAHPEIAKACDKIQGQFTSGTNTITQRAAITALKENPETLKPMTGEFEKRREHFINLLKEIPGLKLNNPTGAFYLFPDVTAFFGKTANGTTINTSEDLSYYLLEEALVATTPGSAFGNPECLRLSYANSMEQLTEAAKRIKEALEKL